MPCWTRSFGGIGNASGVRLDLGGVVIEAPTPASALKSAFLTVAVVHGNKPRRWNHAVLGRRVAATAPRRLAGRRSGSPAIVSVNDGAFGVGVELPGAEVEDAACWSEVFELVPAWGELPDYHTSITVIFYVGQGGTYDESLEQRAPTQGTAGSGPCDHLGLVFLDVVRAREIIAEAGASPPEDLIEFLGSDDVADRLVAAGAVIPVWGMRPWLYRVAAPGRVPSGAPLGVRVGEVKGYPVASGALTVTPGSALRSWTEFDPRAWPVIHLPAGSVTVELELRTIVGYEPIAPDVEVGVLPTVVVRGSRVPMHDEPSLLEGVDPFLAPRSLVTASDCVL